MFLLTYLTPANVAVVMRSTASVCPVHALTFESIDLESSFVVHGRHSC